MEMQKQNKISLFFYSFPVFLAFQEKNHNTPDESKAINELNKYTKNMDKAKDYIKEHIKAEAEQINSVIDKTSKILSYSQQKILVKLQTNLKTLLLNAEMELTNPKSNNVEILKIKYREIMDKFKLIKEKLNLMISPENYWVEDSINQTKISPSQPEDPKFLAYQVDKGSFEQKSHYAMLAFIQKVSGKDAAKKYCVMKDGKFDEDKLFSYFQNTRDTLGFYYVPAKEVTLSGSRIKKFGKGAVKGLTLGAYSPDITRTERYKGGWYVKNEAAKNLMGMVIGDKWVGDEDVNFMEVIKNVSKTINSKDTSTGHPITGFNTQKTKTLTTNLNGTSTEANEVDKAESSKQLASFFKNNKDKWLALPQNELNKMAMMYGSGCHDYLYFYSSKINKIFVVRNKNLNSGLKNMKSDDGYFGGFIDVKGNSMGTTWNGLNEADTRKLLRSTGETAKLV